jgi:hypothetical protein
MTLMMPPLRPSSGCSTRTWSETADVRVSVLRRPRETVEWGESGGVGRTWNVLPQCDPYVVVRRGASRQAEARARH